MEEGNFREILEHKWEEGKFVCVGFDPVLENIPEHVRENCTSMEAVTVFLLAIIHATYDLVCAYKLNVAYYEQFGPAGAVVLRDTISNIKLNAPDVAIILDTKVADATIPTNEAHVAKIFRAYEADACTIYWNPGKKVMRPFLDQKKKGVFVVCRTSNDGAYEFQDLMIAGENIPLYRKVARNVAWTDGWNTNGNCGLVVGATYPRELALIRKDIGYSMPILAPGAGAQGGDLKETVQAARRNFIISFSRSVLWASSGRDFADAARYEVQNSHLAITQYRKEMT